MPGGGASCRSPLGLEAIPKASSCCFPRERVRTGAAVLTPVLIQDAGVPGGSCASSESFFKGIFQEKNGKWLYRHQNTTKL